MERNLNFSGEQISKIQENCVWIICGVQIEMAEDVVIIFAHSPTQTVRVLNYRKLILIEFESKPAHLLYSLPEGWSPSELTKDGSVAACLVDGVISM